MAQVYPIELADSATRLAKQLQSKKVRIVFAESCTAGLVSAAMATVPGISAWLCGSAVTYQDETKAGWLGVTDAELEKFTAVSAEVASSMARGVLKITPAADLALSVTGHLGPGAPTDLDGVIFIGIAFRASKNDAAKPENNTFAVKPAIMTQQIEPPKRVELICRDRASRQLEASLAVLSVAAKRLETQK